MSDLSNTTKLSGGSTAVLPAQGNDHETRQAEGHPKPAPALRRDRLDEIFGDLEVLGGSGGFGRPSPSNHDADPMPGHPQARHQNDDEASPFPVDALPPVMRRMVEGTAIETMLPNSLAAATALATLAAGIGAGLKVRVGRYETPANIAILIGMRSGMGKDDIDRYIVAPLTESDAYIRQRWEMEVRPRLEEELDEAKGKLAYQKKIQRNAQDLEDQMAAAEHIRDAKNEIAGIERRLKQCPKLAMTAPGKIQLGLDMMNQDGEACAILTPEGRESVFKTGDEGFYCAAISGGRWEDARRTRESMRLEHPCLTIMLMAQPDFITRQLERERMVDSGLMPRFLLFICEPKLHAVSIDQPVIPDADTAAWEELVCDTIAAFRLRRDEPVVIDADREVNLLFVEYENENRTRRGGEGEMSDIQSFAARWTEQATRIAAVLHVGLHGAASADHPLSVETASNAIRISRWFAERQIEALFMHREAWMHRRAEHLHGKLVRMRNGKATLGQLAKAGWPNAEVRKLAGLCPDLIVIEDKPAGNRGGRPTESVRAA
jgi:hypothetical protein